MASTTSADVGTSGGFDASQFLQAAQQQTALGSQLSDAMTAEVGKASMSQMKNTMETGNMKMITSMAEGIAKTFKALGDAVKGLC